jgi:hypothetical protein
VKEKREMAAAGSGEGKAGAGEMCLTTRGKGKRSPRMAAQIQTKVSSANRSSKVERGFSRAIGGVFPHNTSESKPERPDNEAMLRIAESLMQRYPNTLRELAK